jgi:hypothetical protein
MIRWLIGTVVALTFLLGGASFTATAAASDNDLGANLVNGGGGKHKHSRKKGTRKHGKRKGGNRKKAEAAV